jgi:predicted NBD/HSP70 family sugar kinase
VRRIDLEKAQAARLNTIRDINRQIVLNYVRERGPISRAEIARETELQRSTVSAIVDALLEDGLVEEIGTGESTGGRPPSLLRLREGGAVAIGVDITTQTTTVATCNLAGRILDRVDFPTDPDASATLDRVTRIVKRMIEASHESVHGVGVVLPGQVDFATGLATYIAYFDWRDVDVAGRISAATGLPVVVDNDANAAALAELWLGRPEVSHVRDFIMVLVHDGVGTGIVFDGQIYRGRNNIAGEFGHMIVGADAPVRCSCGKFHCWEAFACLRSVMARYERLAPERAKEVTEFSQIATRAFEGDAAAVEAIQETGRYLGIGLANLSVGLSPEAIVVSGPFVAAWPLVADIIDDAMNVGLSRGFGRSPIITSTLVESDTLLGALSLVLTLKFGLVTTA